MSGRLNFYSHNLLASSEPKLYKSGIHDGMDSNKTAVPKLANNVKSLSGVGMPLPVKIAGILNQGDGPPCFAHVAVGGLWKSDPNFTISSIAKYLRDCENFNGDVREDLGFTDSEDHPFITALLNKDVFEKTFLRLRKQNSEQFFDMQAGQLEEKFTPLPSTFYLQLDNSGKDNKNWAMMAFLSELVARGVFKTIIMSFLIVGHTHEDVDAFFSKVNKSLACKHVSSIPQLLAEVHGAEEKRAVPRFITEVADYKAHAKPYSNRIKGIRAPVAFKFTMLDNRPIYQYQETYGGPWLPTFGNSIWRRRDPSSKTDFAVVPPPNQDPVNVGMAPNLANAEDILTFLKAYTRYVAAIQDKTDPNSDLYHIDQDIREYWECVMKLLEEGWSTNEGQPLRQGFWPKTNHGTGLRFRCW